jgi:Flp pilus assembly protein TadG
MNQAHLPKTRSSESGQVLIVLALGMLVFLGFVGLALDGGMAFSDRRHSQNAADAAALAGGGAAALSIENSHVFYTGWNCSDGRITAARDQAVTAAIARAANNGFTIDNQIADRHGVTTTCGEEILGSFTDKFIDITVQISSTTQTSFMHLFFGGELRNNVEAVVRVRPRTPLAYGHAVVATGTEGCSGNKYGVIFGGSSDVDVRGGGVWSNGCLSGNGGKYRVDIDGGGICYAGDLEGTINMNPAPVRSPETMPESMISIPAPNCADARAYDNADFNSMNGNLSAGLYCLTGDIRINGGNLIGRGVTLYLSSGDLSINGNASVNIAAPEASPDPAPAIPGVVIYVANGDVDLEGNATSAYLGVVYAPNGTIKAHGANGTTPTFNTQLIGHHVDVSGNADIDINFNAAMNYNKPSALELYR